MKIFESMRNFYLQKFQEQPEPELALKHICNIRVAQMVFLSAYENVEQIEELTQKEKDDLWQYVYNLFPNKDKEFRIMACKIIQTVGTLINI